MVTYGPPVFESLEPDGQDVFKEIDCLPWNVVLKYGQAPDIDCRGILPPVLSQAFVCDPS